jgi:hypothetical protein
MAITRDNLMRLLLPKMLAFMATLLTFAVLSSCADKPGPPPGAPPATINKQDTSQAPPTYGQIREEQKENQ